MLERVARVARRQAELDLALLRGDAAGDGAFDQVRAFGFPVNLRPGTALVHHRAMRDLRRWLETRQIDALLAFSFPSALRAARIAARNALPMAWFWQQSLPLFRSRLAGAKQRISLGLLQRAGCHIVSPTQQGIGRFTGLGVPTRQLHLIRNGVDLPHFACPPQAEADRQALRAKLGVPKADLVIVCVARIDPLKDHETLLEAAALASRSGASLALVCLGAERDRGASLAEALKRRAASLGLEERVLWAGHQRDVRPWLHAADAAALTSREECAPLALVEAGAAGLPLVGTRVGGIPEIVRPGQTGFLIRPGDAAACARAFGELARDTELRRSLGSGALAAARREFDAAAGDARWAELIEMLLAAAR
jgi:glycosyltransferase involved in cell wall biosynthesis